MRTETYGAAEFKANCLAILDRLARHDVDRVTITKRGRPVAVIAPPPSDVDGIKGLHGFMRGSVIVPVGFDLTAPVIDEPVLAEEGHLHG